MCRDRSAETLRKVALLALLLALPAPAHTQDVAPITSPEDAARPRLSWFPIAYYTPETSVAAGAGIIATRRRELASDARPDSLQLYLVYTLKNQAFLRLNPELYFAGDRGKVNLAASYIDMPTSFFGLANSPDLGREEVDRLEEEYSSERFVFSSSLLYRIAGSLRAGARYRFASSRLYDLDPAGALALGSVFGSGGGDVSGVGPAIEWDTRDTVFSPTGGGWYQAWALLSRDSLGSDFDFEHYGIDLRRYLSLPRGQVLALQAVVESTSGDVPFFELPTPPLRGLYQDVFVDRAMAALQAEWRVPIRGRFSGAAFAGVASVAERLSELEPGELYAGGVGVRYALDPEEGITVRLDVGVSPWGVFPYFMIMHAF